MKYEDLAAQLYKKVLSEYNNRSKWDKRSLSIMLNEHLKDFNSEAQKLIEEQVYNNLDTAYFPSSDIPLVASSTELSNMLYKNAKETNKKVTAILSEGNKAKKTINDMAMKIYDGYNTSIDNLNINEKLPKYLLENKDALKQIEKLKNKRLSQTYNKVLKEINNINAKAFEKAMYVALQERARYYASRIAETEASRSRNLSRASEYLQDEEIEFVKYEMSSAHSIIDICDYYASLDVGYGAGIVKKENMQVLPLHPHCHCRYVGVYKKIKKKTIKDPTKETMNKFSDYEKRQILGSHEKLQDFRGGADIEGIFNRVRPKYPISKYRDVLGYNSTMNNIEDKILSNFESVKDDLHGKFGELWQLPKGFDKHIDRRIKLGHITDRKDYIYKTLDCLANSDNYIFAQHSNSWNNVCYNKSKDWAVIFNEDGRMMTSYKIDTENFLGFENRHKSAKQIEKGKTDEKFRKYFKNIRN